MHLPAGVFYIIGRPRAGKLGPEDRKREARLLARRRSVALLGDGRCERRRRRQGAAKRKGRRHLSIRRCVEGGRTQRANSARQQRLRDHRRQIACRDLAPRQHESARRFANESATRLLRSAAEHLNGAVHSLQRHDALYGRAPGGRQSQLHVPNQRCDDRRPRNRRRYQHFGDGAASERVRAQRPHCSRGRHAQGWSRLRLVRRSESDRDDFGRYADAWPGFAAGELIGRDARLLRFATGQLPQPPNRLRQHRSPAPTRRRSSFFTTGRRVLRSSTLRVPKPTTRSKPTLQRSAFEEPKAISAFRRRHCK